MEALKKIAGIGPDQAERRGRHILAAVEEALALPDSLLPRIERPPRRAADPALDARLERLKLVRNRLAARYPLQPGVLCPNGTLEAIARANPAGMAELAAIPSLRRWQAGGGWKRGLNAAGAGLFAWFAARLAFAERA
jgi:ribonuclease D